MALSECDECTVDSCESTEEPECSVVSKGSPKQCYPCGPCGVQGPRGPQGEHGEKGCPGPNNDASGHKGPRGARGKRGQHGPEGDVGQPGEKGCAGHQGPCGARGKRGPRGLMGTQGLAGPQGKTGRRGRVGPMGLVGNQGAQGSTGDGNALIVWSTPSLVALTPTQNLRLYYSFGHGNYGFLRQQTTLERGVVYFPDIQFQLPERPVWLTQLCVTINGAVGPNNQVATVPVITGGLYFDIAASTATSLNVEFTILGPSIIFAGDNSITTARTQTSSQAPILANAMVTQQKLALILRSGVPVPANYSLDLNVSASLAFRFA